MVVWDKFKKLWLYYVFQSALAAVFIFIIVLVFRESFVIISSMGATAFICFALPKNVSAQSRHVIGGHLVGLCCGAIFMLTGFPDCVEIPMAVGLAIFFMVALDKKPRKADFFSLFPQRENLSKTDFLPLKRRFSAFSRHIMGHYLVAEFGWI